MKKADEEQKQQAEDSKKALASLPADQRAKIEEAMNAAQAMAAQMNTPEMRKMRLDGIKAERADRTKQYEQELATWKRDYPESAGPVIAKRLREFLAASADVDFAAKLTSRNGKMVFENPRRTSRSRGSGRCATAPGRKRPAPPAPPPKPGSRSSVPPGLCPGLCPGPSSLSPAASAPVASAEGGVLESSVGWRASGPRVTSGR